MHNLSTYFNLSSQFAYSLCHFYWAPMKNKGCSLLGLPMLKAKLSENFFFQNYDLLFRLLGGLEIRGMKIGDFYW